MRKKRNFPTERLSDAELDIMRVLWESGTEMRVAEIVRSLSETHSWKPQTAHVLLGRLEEKKFVKVDKSGYYHTFKASVSEGDYLAYESDVLLRRVGGSVKAMVVSMVDTEGVTAEELAELTELLESKRRELMKKEK